MANGRLTDMTQPPPDDVFDSLLKEQGKQGFFAQKREECEKFHHWSADRVRAFWSIVNIALWSSTKTEQAILDDYFPIVPEGFAVHVYRS